MLVGEDGVAFVLKKTANKQRRWVKSGDANLSSSTPPLDDGVFVETLEKCKFPASCEVQCPPLSAGHSLSEHESAGTAAGCRHPGRQHSSCAWFPCVACASFLQSKSPGPARDADDSSRWETAGTTGAFVYCCCLVPMNKQGRYEAVCSCGCWGHLLLQGAAGSIIRKRRADACDNNQVTRGCANNRVCLRGSTKGRGKHEHSRSYHMY